MAWLTIVPMAISPVWMHWMGKFALFSSKISATNSVISSSISELIAIPLKILLTNLAINASSFSSKS